MSTPEPDALGAAYLGDERTLFRVWAPRAGTVAVQVDQPTARRVPLIPEPRGYFAATLDGIGPGARYTFVLDDSLERPDPASRSQPDGVHAPSAVVDLRTFAWTDASWRGLPLDQYVIYELHVGTFSDEGTFDGAIARLDDLRDLGITAVELMPVAQFPGERNWGYDGVYPFAVQHSYGGPDGLRRLVDACHARGLAVILDVVYNHLGPEGNYLADFGPYFTDHYRTAWGAAVNVDGAGSDEVRRYFISNALWWLANFHFDALRLDAVHAIYDQSAIPFLAELSAAVHARVHELGWPRYLIAESDLNDPRVITPVTEGGLGCDAQWADDFQHAIDSVLTGEQSIYWRDFGHFADIATTLRQAYVYTGQYSVRRQHRHGAPPRTTRGEQFVVCVQNHDQIGNRAEGARLSTLVSFEAQKLAAAALLLSPCLPLLFMGEEYGETAPFLYFTSHGDADLIAAVRAGRAEEFAHLADTEPPDPQAPETLAASRLRWELRTQGRHAQVLALHRELLALRQAVPALRQRSLAAQDVTLDEASGVVTVRRWHDASDAVVIFAFGGEATEAVLPLPDGRWLARFDSEDPRWGGAGALMPEQIDGGEQRRVRIPGYACVLLTRQNPTKEQ